MNTSSHAVSSRYLTPVPLGYQRRAITAKVGEDLQLQFESNSLDDFYADPALRGDAQRFLDKVVASDGLRSEEEPREDLLADSTTDQGTWDRANGVFSYQGALVPLAGGEEEFHFTYKASSNFPNGPLLAEETFGITADGSIAGDSFASPQNSERVENLLKSAALWQAESQALDGQTGVDLNPERGSTVAPKVPIAIVAETLANDVVMRDSQHAVKYSALDFQSGENDFLVSGATTSGALNILSGTSNENGDLQLTFKSFLAREVEKLSLSKADGTVNYQRFEHHEPCY